MDEGHGRYPAVPAPGRRPVPSLTGQPEAGPGAVIAAGAAGCPGRRRHRCGCTGRRAYAMGRSGPVKFIHQADAASHGFL